LKAGGDRVAAWLSPTKLHAVDQDMESGQLHVPAIFQFQVLVNGNRLSPEPACRSFPVLRVFGFFFFTALLSQSASASNVLHLAMALAMVQ